MNDFETKVTTFLGALTNVYRDEEEQAPVLPLELPNDGNFTQDMTAILVAFYVFFRQACPQMAADMNILTFTHLLNCLAIQHCFGDKMENGEGAE